jgi:DNA polymerase alpha subunit A
MPSVPDPELKKGILPRLLGTLVDRRRVIKSLMKDPKASEADLAQVCYNF